MRSGRSLFLALAALLAAAALFAVLITAIPSRRPSGGPPPSRGDASVRQVYSPTISDDPYVVEQWEKSVRALEQACAESGEYCKEARAARLMLSRER